MTTTNQTAPHDRPPRERSPLDDIRSSTTTNFENAIPLGAPPDETTKKTKKHRRRSPTRVHKKKSNRPAKRPPGARSRGPLRGRSSPESLSPKSFASLSPKSLSPKPSSSPCPQLCGKLWIRPVAARRRVGEAGGDRDRPPVPPVPPIPLLDPPVRQAATTSPIHDRELMRAVHRKISFGLGLSLRKGGGSVGPRHARIIFGESGKLIRLRRAL